MTPEMILTMIVLVFAIILFIFEWVRVDVVGIIMMVMLPLIGLVSPKEAFVGLSSNAVCSIIAVIIIGAGLDTSVPFELNAGPVYENLPGENKTLVTFEAADHMLFSASCFDWLVQMGVTQYCLDPVWDTARAHDLTNHFVTAFLLDVLYNDEDAAAALDRGFESARQRPVVLRSGPTRPGAPLCAGADRVRSALHRLLPRPGPGPRRV